MKKHTLLQRLLPLAMLAAMLLSAVPAAAAFRDTAGHWAEKTLDEWQDEGLIDGYGDGSFQPNGTVTRAEFIKLVNRTLGFTAESEISFSDVTERDWFHAEVAKAVTAGYAQGSGGLFRPNQPVTRAEAATMLARAAGLAANEERADAFADAASIPAWAKGSVGAAAEAGYMTGYPDGTFGALGSITRAEAVVTLDRVRASRQETVIEKAGTTLENETVLGDLVIAESVGEGNVTLKNVTVLGSVIIKGGGANSVYFDGVRVGGAVRLEKEGVHLRLRGDTALERVEIGLPCRITRDSTFKGTLDALVIDLEKTSNQKIQIEVPAKLVELLSRANVALNADVETLQIDKDAEGAQLDIRRGVTVGELSIDARVALTGSGLVVSLVVSVSGVTVSSTLTVKKTETEGGAKAPTTSGSSSSGGSSGGSYVPVRIVTGAAAVPDVTVPHGTSEADAMGRLPGTVTLNVTENGAAGTVEAAVRWALDRAYSKDPCMDTVYTATGTVTIPDGYTYDGTLTVTASLTVTADPENVVVGILEVAGLELPYGAQESDVQLPVQVTVEIKNGDTERADVTWTLEGEWASPGVNTFMGTVDMPIDQYYNGERTADITTTVTVVESGVTPKTKAVVDHVPLRLTSIDYASTGELVLAAARQGLPTNVLLKCEDGSYIEVAVRPDDWEFTQTPYVPTSGKNQTVSFTENAALPEGYAYDGGTSPVRCYVEVKALDTAALEGALAAAKTQLDTLTDSEDAALADSEKIFVAANGVTADSVTKGVKFVEQGRVDALDSAYSAAWSKQSGDAFASQAECDSLTQNLQAKTAALEDAVQTGTNVNARAYVKSMVEDALSADRNPDAPYHSVKQPLKEGSFYSLFHFIGMSLPGSDMVLSSISWSAKGDGADLVDIGTGVGSNPDAYGAKITSAPAEPKSVTFVAEAVCTHQTDPSKAFTFTFEYTAIIGAPISLSSNKAGAPLFASGTDSTGEIFINLNGVEAIEAVKASEISIAGQSGDAARPGIFQINKPAIKGGRPSTYGVCLDAVLTTAQLSAAQNFPISSGSNTDLAHVTGIVTVTIPKGALTLKEETGWYFPDADLTQEVEIWLVNPQLGVNTQMVIDGDRAKRNISVTAKYIGDAPVQVAYTKTNTAPDVNHPENDDNVRVWVTLLPSQAATGSDGEKIYSVNNVSGFGEAGEYYIWCRAWGGATGVWLDTKGSFVVD